MWSVSGSVEKKIARKYGFLVFFASILDKNQTGATMSLFKHFHRCILSYSLILLPSILSAELPSQSPESFVSGYFDKIKNRNRKHSSSSSDHAGEKPQHISKEKRLKPLTSKDFEGRWTGSIRTIGGLGGLSIGQVLASESQIIFDKHGDGFITNATVTSYGGTPGDLVNIAYKSPQVTAHIDIIDAENGVINLVYVALDPALPRETQTVYCVVKRSLEDGKVISFTGHKTSFDDGTSNITSQIYERQYEK